MLKGDAFLYSVGGVHRREDRREHYRVDILFSSYILPRPRLQLQLETLCWLFNHTPLIWELRIPSLCRRNFQLPHVEPDPADDLLMT